MKKYIVFLLFALVSFSSCDNDNYSKRRKNNQLLLASLLVLQNSCNHSGGEFWTIDFNTGNYYCANTSLVGSDSGISVYLEKGLTQLHEQYGITAPDYQSIAESFSSTIQPNVTPAIGDPTDINGDGEITVVFFGVKSAASSSGSFVGGYVDPINFYSIPSTGVGGVYSNRREIIYLNGLELFALREILLRENKPDIVLSTLAHEYQHLVRAPYELGHPNATSPISLPRTQEELDLIQFDDRWINEGTSEVVSDIAGYGPQSDRMACFLGDPASSCQDGVAGLSLFEWGGNLYNYAYAYAFMSYIYNSSGTSDSDRNTYLKYTVTGINDVRGDNISSLMEIFKSYGSNYNSSILTSESQGMFERLFASFWAQTLKYPSGSSAYYGDTTAVSMTDLYNTYPYSSSLSSLLDKPKNIPLVSASSFDLSASEMYRVSGSSSGPSDSNSVVAANSDGSEYVVFNGQLSSTDYSSTTASILANEKNIKWSREYLPSSGSGCPSSYLWKNLKYIFQNQLQR